MFSKNDEVIGIINACPKAAKENALGLKINGVTVGCTVTLLHHLYALFRREMQEPGGGKPISVTFGPFYAQLDGLQNKFNIRGDEQLDDEHPRSTSGWGNAVRYVIWVNVIP